MPEEASPKAEVDAALDALYGGRRPGRAAEALVRSMLASVHELSGEDSNLGDLKLADAALAEMTRAFKIFRPYRSYRKVSMFGSARTRPEDPVYVLARELAARMATSDWMTVTGAGPGIMAAGSEGAGPSHAFGVNIRLPMESDANPFIAQDPKLVEMRYFFTRKLMLIKESDAYAVLPGGFGTQDECYELLTLLQTGKAEPAPVVLVETPGGSYWREWKRFVLEEGIGYGYISHDDLALFSVANTVDEAEREIRTFFSNYQSCRWVGDLLVLRMKTAPSNAELSELRRRFGDLAAAGTIRRTGPLPPERTGQDHLELDRLALRFDKVQYGRLRRLIDALNECTGT